ncbi:hypothetical protein PENVUL_c003G03669 [Penicillium vulpinum]|uniref:Uncharacterized protein n=2 Tax=Penicillium vulpinum TaxID=29845 RepID=A0A1V6SAP3_9EURO|nr:hypothetical protein PENVUL_c003G03669 [Penicillium vulpinum]
MARVKKSKITPTEYLDGIKADSLICPWNTGDWKKAHGDGKAGTLGAYRMSSMKTSTELREYQVQILYLKKPMLSFTLPGTLDKDGSTNPPTSQEVIDTLKTELSKNGK